MDEAVRITIEYTGKTRTVTSVRRVSMRVPNARVLPTDRSFEPEIGHFAELRGAQDKVLYRCVVNDLFPSTVEVPTGDADRPFAQAPAGEMKRLAVLLVPAVPGATKVVLLESWRRRKSRRAKRESLQTREVLAVDLEDSYGKEEG